MKIVVGTRCSTRGAHRTNGKKFFPMLRTLHCISQQLG